MSGDGAAALGRPAAAAAVPWKDHVVGSGERAWTG